MSKRKFVTLKLFSFSTIIAFLLSSFLALLINHPRPLSYYFNLLYFSASFPSKHVIISTLISLFLIKENRLLLISSLVLLIFVAFLSWVSLLHWPGDIIAGFILAIVVFYFLNFLQWLYFQKIKNKF
ncbi:MAG: phosphatase PAP2 family protein [Patescibacteria group bacterium]|nr:phosphatase PAP2 family protein [Patescibacteria group bacterium]